MCVYVYIYIFIYLFVYLFIKPERRRYGPWHTGSKVGSQVSRRQSSGCGDMPTMAVHTPLGRMPGRHGAAKPRLAPGKWKSRIRTAQRCALQRERWSATIGRHQGLLFKQLCRLGARTPVDILAGSSLQVRNALANCVLARCTLFSTHGRVEESRRLA